MTITAPRRFPDEPDPGRTAEWFRRLRALPEGQEKQRLRAALLEAWLPMARRLASRYQERGEPYEDLCQVAALGLMKAIDRYDPERAGAFASFAVPTVRGEIKRHFRDNTWGLHVPRRVQELRTVVRAALNALGPRTAPRRPTVEELAAHTALSGEDVRRGLEAVHSYRPVSLEALLNPHVPFAVGDVQGAAEPGYALVEDRESVRRALAALPEREKRILYLRFFRSMTQGSIGAELGLSQMHVSRLIAQACARVRSHVESDQAAAGPERGSADVPS
ncbi:MULTISPECIES: SigB/SigF/SigG family RNA polymerase sigma factor [Streptomyces]|uniref:SigB/SigF/SigG family RNA polymerase sigma factor n=1 Tax=Streptomyces rutgersensis TaxID=53451 RepID=A0ABX6RTR5_9ACTN|nr:MULTISPECIES: SigB/SigF/SigG family RNA polymerase sigma factor [Streptomyces]NEE32888.1 SigB/SigF/SigG family RNA polymerase sigma factor [Streptomyces sp. SID7982]NEE52277.1 SigB/SigF/SigG family RNA polymerase sigma factor [Streptomyces sp. SID8455]MBL3803349.1 SigB/SigF/SigG family RNA polymerase sigma factor [Streptomyces sp. BRB081]MDQ0292393.1 RNA polymerase sigma-B factor [Streptomyces sp. DSM 41037]NEC11615.1 SigB/SigF/SigG family RNA polymerase sigma factor [Streptomyces sp. SID80